MTRTLTWPRATLVLGLAAVLLASWPVASAAAQGAVSHKCFISGQNVRIESGTKVTCRSLNVLGGDVHIEPGAELDGALKVAGNVTVAGTVTDDVWAAGDLTVPATGKIEGNASVTGNATVAGSVSGDLTVMGNVDIAATATVNAVSAGGDVRRAEGAQVRDTARSSQRAGNPVSLGLLLLFALLSAGFAGLMSAIAEPALDRTRQAATGSPLLALVVGVLAWALTVLLLVPLAFTIIGPVFWLGALGVGTALGWAAFSDGLGHRLWASGARPVAAALGGALLALAVMACLVGGGWLSRAGTGAAGGPVICLGLVLLLGIWTWGLGGSLLTYFGTRPWPRVAPVPTGGDGQAVPLPVPVDDDTARVAAGAVAGTAVAVAAVTAVEPVTDAEPAAGAGVAEAAVVAAAASAVVAEEGPAAEAEGLAPEAAFVASEAAVAATVAESVAPGESPDAEADAPAVAAGAADAAGWDLTAAAADVRSVPGVSPIFGFLLAEGGIKSVGDLAAASPEQIRAALSVPGVVPVDEATLGAWQSAARRLVAGGA